MRNTIIFLLTIFIALLAGYEANAQDIPKEDQRIVSQKFVDSAAKSFTEVVVLRELAEAREAENNALRQQNLLLTEQNSLLKENSRQKDDVIDAQRKENEALRKLKCPTTSILWGAIKWKRCS